MLSKDIIEYYQSTKYRDIREDLAFAVTKVSDRKVAIDCGCGSGADIRYLVDRGFKVYGFDIENQAISVCKKRFKNEKNVFLSRADFLSFEYPKASLVVADASLFFCPKLEFNKVWSKIYECLDRNGVFCGSFLGLEDTMASPEASDTAFWPNISAFKEKQVRTFFKDFYLCRFIEHKISGNTSQGIPHNWHIYSVVAVRK